VRPLRVSVLGLPFKDFEHPQQRGSPEVATLWEIPVIITFLRFLFRGRSTNSFNMLSMSRWGFFEQLRWQAALRPRCVPCSGEQNQDTGPATLARVPASECHQGKTVCGAGVFSGLL
jgi:hypothetical protein